jgi:hypothetical protein
MLIPAKYIERLLGSRQPCLLYLLVEECPEEDNGHIKEGNGKHALHSGNQMLAVFG